MWLKSASVSVSAIRLLLTLTIKGSSLRTCPMLKAFSSENLSSRKRAPKRGFLGQKGVKSLTFGFANPKGTSLRETASFDVFCVKIRKGVLAADKMKNPKNKKKTNK